FFGYPRPTRPFVPTVPIRNFSVSANRPVHVLRALTAQMSQCESSPFRPNRPVRVLRVPLSHLLPDCLGQILPIHPVRRFASAAYFWPDCPGAKVFCFGRSGWFASSRPECPKLFCSA
ncbi:hypothetical protein KI387_016965, partial [Taxus chinensis]